MSHFDRLQRITPLADQVTGEIVREETGILEEITPRTSKVMQKVAECSCEYVGRGRLGRQSPLLSFACADDCSENGWRTGPPGMIEEWRTWEIEDFDLVVNVEAL